MVNVHLSTNDHRYKYRFPFLEEEDGIVSVDDNRVGPLYKHVFPPQLAPHISFIGLPFKVSRPTSSLIYVPLELVFHSFNV